MFSIFTTLISKVGQRLLNKYTSKSIGLFGVLWLMYAGVNNLNAENSQIIAMALSQISVMQVKQGLQIIQYLALLAICLWIAYLAIDNLFRKSVNEPTLIMLILINLFKIKKK